MIETVMIFALGFLTAGLIALLVFPAVNARAERLARRRVEAQFPLSISELTAEKDYLRAEFAVLQRRLERKVEEALAEKHQDMEELGRRAVKIDALERDLAGRDERILDLEAELAATQHRLTQAQDAAGAADADLAGSRDTLAVLETAHRQTLDELASTRARLDQMTTTLAETRTALETTQERLAEQQAAYADLEANSSATLSEVDARRITISDLETRLGTQTGRGNEFERLAADRRAELTAERQRLADLAKELVAEQERSIALEERNRLLETERDAKVMELRALTDRMAAARDGPALEGMLAEARAERERLEGELAAANRRADAAKAGIEAENAELRRRIEEVADEILRATKTEETRAQTAPAA